MGSTCTTWIVRFNVESREEYQPPPCYIDTAVLIGLFVSLFSYSVHSILYYFDPLRKA
jgi:hypothetical protein